MRREVDDGDGLVSVGKDIVRADVAVQLLPRQRAESVQMLSHAGEGLPGRRGDKPVMPEQPPGNFPMRKKSGSLDLARLIRGRPGVVDLGEGCAEVVGRRVGRGEAEPVRDRHTCPRRSALAGSKLGFGLNMRRYEHADQHQERSGRQDQDYGAGAHEEPVPACLPLPLLRRNLRPGLAIARVRRIVQAWPGCPSRWRAEPHHIASRDHVLAAYPPQPPATRAKKRRHWLAGSLAPARHRIGAASPDLGGNCAPC